MRLTLVVPDRVRVPVGGIKVAYEYANRLHRRGHDVVVVHLDLLAGSGAGRVARWRRDLRIALWQRGIGAWFRLDQGVRTSLLDPAHPELLPASDAVVACGWRTAPFVSGAPERAGRRHYLVQGYMAPTEGEPGEVDAAWRLPLRKIVISRWLEEKCREILGPNADVVRIPVAIDHAVFRPLRDPAGRFPASIAMLYHASPAKGASDGLAAMAIARESHPELSALLFGTEEPDSLLPKWASFERQPRDLAGLYNRSAIFLHTSWLEGWPLPPAEAMASGCALVAAANEGVTEYAVHERNALLAPLRDTDALAAAIVRLIEDQPLRLRLAHQGMADMRAYAWERSTALLEAVLAGVKSD